MNWMTSAKKRATKWSHDNGQTLSMRGHDDLFHHLYHPRQPVVQKRQLNMDSHQALTPTAPALAVPPKKMKISSDIFLLEQPEPMEMPEPFSPTLAPDINTAADMNFSSTPSHAHTTEDLHSVSQHYQYSYGHSTLTNGSVIPVIGGSSTRMDGGMSGGGMGGGGGIDDLEYTPYGQRADSLTEGPADSPVLALDLVWQHENEHSNSILFYNDRTPCTEQGTTDIITEIESHQQSNHTISNSSSSSSAVTGNIFSQFTQQPQQYMSMSTSAVIPVPTPAPTSVAIGTDSSSSNICSSNTAAATTTATSTTIISEWNLFQ